MKTSSKLVLLLAMILSVTAFHESAHSQNKFSVRYLTQMRSESSISYNFFVGPDAADFSTSVNGFGSGLLDFAGMRTAVDLINLGTEKNYISIGAGFSVLKYRLSKNLVFGKDDDGALTWMVDPDTSHNYVNTFFGYGKSKIITTSFYFPLDLNIAVGENVVVTAGGYLDLNLTARYKMKYLVGEDKVEEIIKSDEFRKFNPSTTKFGVNFTILHKKIGYGLSATYCLTPFFVPGTGPDIHEARVTASYSIRNLKELMKEKD